MPTYHVHFEKRDPETNQFRFYALRAVPALFGDWTLVREWGRIGSPGRCVGDWFETLEATQEALARKQRQKRKRGYGKVGQSGGIGEPQPPFASPRGGQGVQASLATLPLF